MSATLDSLNHRAKRPGVPGPGGGGGGGGAPKKKKKKNVFFFTFFFFFFSFFFGPPPPPPQSLLPHQSRDLGPQSTALLSLEPGLRTKTARVSTYINMSGASGLRPRNKIINTLRLTTEEQPHTAHHLYHPPL